MGKAASMKNLLEKFFVGYGPDFLGSLSRLKDHMQLKNRLMTVGFSLEEARQHIEVCAAMGRSVGVEFDPDACFESGLLMKRLEWNSPKQEREMSVTDHKRTKAEMVNALLNMIQRTETRSDPPHPSDDDMILSAAITELDEARREIQRLRGEIEFARREFNGIGLQAYVVGADKINQRATEAGERMFKALKEEE